MDSFETVPRLAATVICEKSGIEEETNPDCRITAVDGELFAIETENLLECFRAAIDCN